MCVKYLLHRFGCSCAIQRIVPAGYHNWLEEARLVGVLGHINLFPMERWYQAGYQYMHLGVGGIKIMAIR